MHNSRLSDTDGGGLWLSQFQESDQENAKLLLDDLLYISNEDLIKGLYKIVTCYAKKFFSDTIAVFAARENTGEKYWPNESKRPLGVCGRKSVGSEGIIVGFCRDIALSNPKIINHPSIQEMRIKKCRYIFIIDDMIASGTRMNNFVKWLYENKTIRSWHSLGYIRFIACANVSSIIGEKCVLKSKLFSNILKFQSTGDGNSKWSKEKKDQIIKLCTNYAEYTDRKYCALGFEDAFTTILLPHKCPNTNPAILWSSKENSWNAIFSDRPEFIFEKIPINRQDDNQDRILKKLGHTRLTKSSLFNKINKKSRRLLILLSCIASRKRKKNILSAMLELPIPVIRQQLEREYGVTYLENQAKNAYNSC